MWVILKLNREYTNRPWTLKAPTLKAFSKWTWPPAMCLNLTTIASFNHSLTLECTIFIKCWQEHNSEINSSILLSKLHSAKVQVIDNAIHFIIFINYSWFYQAAIAALLETFQNQLQSENLKSALTSKSVISAKMWLLFFTV